ncbi:short-chain dehydrogenase/reductase family 42E member 1-like [Tubulanus polymorphus]|uniref:short-chain dehydrogenase/reductase family 42E member 1-like n=1 Tax=Tubulanus polymorphus TaxID=672921 RepID=UPI003DA5BC2C
MVVTRRMKLETEFEKHVVTGGGGYLGYKLGLYLLERGIHVTLFDCRDEPYGEMKPGMTYVKGDVRDSSSVEAVLENADCVYHLASYGMSGREQLNSKLIEDVNINGTENVLKGCRKQTVRRLVYTSTYNVVFGGQEIINGDETLPYLPLNKHSDHYSRTKSIAEQKVLAADCDELKTCALRLAGVYGPGEQRHLPRIISLIEMGLFVFTYGDKDSLVDFLHADNLIQAEYLAGVKLSEKHSCKAAGQAYFICDNKPVNNFEFFRPLVEGLGYSFPKVSLPFNFMFFIAFLTEWLHFIIGRVYNFQPLLTRTEVYKTGITHYFSIEKARSELGYNPTKQNAMDEVLQYYIEQGRFKKPQSRGMRLLVDVILACVFASLLLSFLPMTN